MKKGDDLKQIKELLEIVKHKVDIMEIGRTGQSASIHLIKDQQSVMNEKLDVIGNTQEDHTRRFEALSGDVEQLHMDVKGIRDEIGLWHQRDKREIDEIKKHLNLPIIPDIPQ